MPRLKILPTFEPVRNILGSYSRVFIHPITKKNTLRGNGVNPATGLQTGSNSKFIRYWFEIPRELLNIKWFLLNDGGDARKWYGNFLSVINWSENGKEIRNHNSSVVRNSQYYFKEGGTWNRISSTFFSVRYLPSGFIFDQAADSFFCDRNQDLNTMIGFLNSCIGFSIAKILCPTLNTTAGNLESFPFPKCNEKEKNRYFSIKSY